ncbi:hypothetical protein D3C72_1231690 [compost metagenome]
MRQFVDGREQGLGLVAQRRHCHAKEHREHDDLQDLVVRHGFGKGFGHRVVNEFTQRELARGQVGGCAHIRQRQSQVVARLQHIGQHHAQQQRHERCRQKPQHGLEEHPANRCGIAHVRNAHDQGGEHQRPDQHLDQTQKDIGDQGDIAGDFLDLGRVRHAGMDDIAHHDTQHHGGQNDQGRRHALFAR